MKRFSFIAFLAIILSLVPSCKKAPMEIPVSSISFAESKMELTVGEQVPLFPVITPGNATNKKLSWSSSKDAVATVTADGIVEAISVGTAFITATSEDGGVNAKCKILVKENVLTVTGEASHISCRNAQLSGKVNLPEITTTNLSFGVLYSTSSGVLLNSAIQLEAKQFDAEYNFTVETGVLEPETIYYYRSFIIKNDEVEYGQIQSFTTLAVSSLIQTLDAGSINPKDAILNASLNLTDCRYESLEYGFELTPEGGQTTTLIADNHADNSFSYQADNLTLNKYSYAAYVKLDDKVYKGKPKTFSTTSIQASVTAEVSDVQSTSAKISGSLNIQSEGSFSTSAVLYFSSSESTLEGLRSNGKIKTLTLEEDGSYSDTLSELTKSTAYNFVVVANVDDVEFASQIGYFSTLEYSIPSQVDLGLSVKWASFNLGATKPTEFGGYYQWAGTEDVSDKNIYLDWNNCPYHTDFNEYSGWLKYHGKVDNKTVLEAEDDAATVALGGNWRIPTDAEWSELRNTDNCSWTWTTIDGVCGYKVQSKKFGYTDKWIFLPAAGRRSHNQLNGDGVFGKYWSSSLYKGSQHCAYNRYFCETDDATDGEYRYLGLSVRPVSE